MAQGALPRAASAPALLAPLLAPGTPALAWPPLLPLTRSDARAKDMLEQDSELMALAEQLADALASVSPSAPAKAPTPAMPRSSELTLPEVEAAMRLDALNGVRAPGVTSASEALECVQSVAKSLSLRRTARA